MSDEILKEKKVLLTANNLNSQVLDIPAPTTPEKPSGGQVPQTPTSTTQQASYYNPEKEIDKLHKWLYGIVIAVVIAYFFMLFDYVNEKQIIINYGNLSDKYFDRYLELNKSFNDLSSSIKDQRISELTKKNDELSSFTICLKNKKYWEYEQCFK